MDMYEQICDSDSDGKNEKEEWLNQSRVCLQTR